MKSSDDKPKTTAAWKLKDGNLECHWHCIQPEVEHPIRRIDSKSRSLEAA